MPELPELEVVKEVLQRRVVGCAIEGVQAIGGGSAIIVRASSSAESSTARTRYWETIRTAWRDQISLTGFDP